MVEDLVKEFDGHVAVKGVSFEVYRGEIYGLLGPNGAGKTTLLSMIAGIMSSDSGKVLIGGLSPLNPRVRETIGYCPQEAVVYSDLTGFENMMFYAGLHGLGGSEARKRCRELLELMGLESYMDKKVKTYSGGMKKRLSFAISLIGDPQLLLLDEPTMGMDPGIRRVIWDIILDLKGRDKAIILATHYMEEADELSDRVAIMDLGRIVAEGSPDGLKRDYGPKAVIDVELTAPIIKPKLIVDNLKQYASDGKVIYEDNMLRVHVEDPDEAAPRIISAVMEKGMRLKSLKITTPTLEDVFLRLTGRRLVEDVVESG